MGHMSYNRVGFRLHPKRFSVQRFRSRFMFLFSIFNKHWRSSCSRALHSLKKVFARPSYSCGGLKNSSSRRGLVVSDRQGYYDHKNNVNNRTVLQQDLRLRSFGRSNSFYAEAIADCLEFIKRSSVSVDQ